MSRIYRAVYRNTPAAANLTTPLMGITSTAAIRTALREYTIGSSATPANSSSGWTIQRHTAALAAGTSITPAPKDSGDPASVTICMQGPSMTVASVTTLLDQFDLNQNNTYRWVASDGRGYICPASANNGVSLYCGVNNGGLYSSGGVWEFDE